MEPAIRSSRWEVSDRPRHLVDNGLARERPLPARETAGRPARPLPRSAESSSADRTPTCRSCRVALRGRLPLALLLRALGFLHLLPLGLALKFLALLEGQAPRAAVHQELGEHVGRHLPACARR